MDSLNIKVSFFQFQNIKVSFFQFQIGKTRFHKSHHFDKFEVPYLTDKERPGIGGTTLYNSKSERLYPSIYARGDGAEIPAWIAYDRQV